MSGAPGDAELAARLARGAGEIALAVRAAGLFDAKAAGDAADGIANAFLCRAIAVARPDDGLLSEESDCDGSRLGKDRVWIVDPVDGTREYGEGRPDWAVHVALVEGGKAGVGAVALPGVDGSPVLRSDLPRPLPPAPARLRMAVSRTRPPTEAIAVAERLGAELVPMGSAGAKAMAIILGQADIYLHTGGQHEWDSAAPVAVATAHGLHCSRIDGSALVYNCPQVWLPDLLICRVEHADAVLALIAAEGGASG